MTVLASDPVGSLGLEEVAVVVAIPVVRAIRVLPVVRVNKTIRLLLHLHPNLRVSF